MKKWLAKYRTILSVIWVLFLFMIAFVYAMFQGGFVSWFVFYSFLPVLVYTIAMASYSLKDIDVRRVIKTDALNAGETMNVTLEISRKRSFPLFYLVIEDQLPEALLQRPKSEDAPVVQPKGLFSLNFQKRAGYDYKIANVPRGEYTLESVMVKTGDIFGFIQKSRTIRVKDEFIVYPQVKELGGWLPPHQSHGGKHRSNNRFEFDITSVSSVRDYKPGDRLSWLDWKTTAKQNKLVTKEFEHPLNRDVVVVLDGTYHRDGDESLFERATSIAASTATKALRSGSSVGLLSVGRNSRLIQMNDYAYHRYTILNHLARVHRQGNIHPAGEIRRYLSQFPPQVSAILISQRMDEHMVGLLYDFHSRGMAVDFFFNVSGGQRSLTDYEQQHIMRLRSMGLMVHVIDHEAFDAVVKAGVDRATS
ncbi:DUF58 domain-containing protein [Tuberibacillus sp. Marseille-P3662]|uniref:DUF58 domain-containing protein n=1 Tax=Tuberibacillus sp. Marseille-P3662 TaxID=1965358 RepID=UPI000A1CDE4C|nr:DUF58 domain-containing protein [Tuberibacillus sp. Marseille-P3662]